MKSFALSFALSLSLSFYAVLQFVHSNWSYCILTDHWFLMTWRAVCVCECVCVFCTLYVVWWGVVIPMTFTSIICTALVALDESVLFLTLTFIWLEIKLFFYLHKKLIVLNAIIEWGNKIESICVSIPKQRWIMSLINSMAMTAIRMKNLHDLFMPTCATGVINLIQFNSMNYSDRFLGSELVFCSPLFAFCFYIQRFFKSGQPGWTWVPNVQTINATTQRDFYAIFTQIFGLANFNQLRAANCENWRNRKISINAPKSTGNGLLEALKF